MGHDPFRDASALRERAAALAVENERLRAENAQLRELVKKLGASDAASRIDALIAERDDLAAKLEQLRLRQTVVFSRIKDDVSMAKASEAGRKVAELRVENHFLLERLAACEEQLRARESTASHAEREDDDVQRCDEDG
jgi:regulator of replication initiation timing